MNQSAGESVLEYLDLALKHLGSASGDLDIPDPIAHADLQAGWPSYRESLVRKVLSNDYAPAHVEIVDLPKDVISVRPLARLRPEHRLVYDAAVFAAANSIESAIPRGVYSYRWWKKRQRLVGPGKMWITMQRVAKALHNKKPSLLLARTDVTAFYEHIEVDQLIEDLGALDVPAWSIEVLETFLRAFNGLSHAWGLPQGPDSSGILANLYLIPLIWNSREEGTATSDTRTICTSSPMTGLGFAR